MEQASNGFSEGLFMDLDPMSTPNNAVTSALNATLVTYNGNEYILLNDMGNGRVETAFLPEGFVPVGTCSFGGIIYITSYNPLTGVSLIGSFPSPERNFGLEKDNSSSISITDAVCFKREEDVTNYFNVINIPISPDVILSPGDKFMLTLTKEDLTGLFGYIDGIFANNDQTTEITCAELAIGILQGSNVSELTSLKNFESVIGDTTYQTLFRKHEITAENNVDIDSYRTLVLGQYHVVSGSYSGKLCLIIKLKIIDTFDIKYTAKLFIDE